MPGRLLQSDKPGDAARDYFVGRHVVAELEQYGQRELVADWFKVRQVRVILDDPTKTTIHVVAPKTTVSPLIRSTPIASS